MRTDMTSFVFFFGKNFSKTATFLLAYYIQYVIIIIYYKKDIEKRIQGVVDVKGSLEEYLNRQETPVLLAALRDYERKESLVDFEKNIVKMLKQILNTRDPCLLPDKDE